MCCTVGRSFVNVVINWYISSLVMLGVLTLTTTCFGSVLAIDMLVS